METIPPYYSKWDTPKLRSQFHKAVFNGRTNKVQRLLAAGENVYATTDTDENMLFIAIARDHEDIFNQILDIYEEDLHFVQHFYRTQYNIDWKHRPIYVAHGSNHIDLVKELSTNMECCADNIRDNTQGMTILLKSSHQVKELLWLQPKNREEDIRIAKIIECIWDDGVIDLHHQGHWGRTVLEVAAIRNKADLYCRLYPLVNPGPEKSIEHFLQLCRHQPDKLKFFKNLLGKFCQQFDMQEILSTTPNIVVLPAYYDQIEIFQLFLEILAAKTATPESKQVVMSNILDTYKITDATTLMESIVWINCKEFVKQCLLRFKPNLLMVGGSNETLLQSLIRQKSSDFMTQFIVEGFDEVLKSGMEHKIVKRLINENWFDAIKLIYDRYESCRGVLFQDREKGLKCLLNAIDACHYNLVNYLVNAHRADLTDPDDVIQLILYCSFVQRGNVVLQTLLSLPAADPLKITGPQHYFKSPFFVALKFRHLKNFKLLLDKVDNPNALKDLKEDNGENLLFAAIWFKENPVDETPFVYVEEEQASLEIIDSSDDEEESERKLMHNKRVLKSEGPYKDPIMPASFFGEQRIEVNRIFNFLLNECHLDHLCVNNDGQTLLHFAVKHDNYDVVKQLLHCGLDPNSKDNAGNSVVHGVRSVAVLNALRDYKCDINSVNLIGETPLFVYVKELTDNADTGTQEQEEFLVELIKVGADVHHADVNGLTALHNVKSVKIALTLLEYGAPINAQNKEGETPLLYIFRTQAGLQSLYKVFLCHNELDTTLVSEKGNSILSVLVSLNEEIMAEVVAAFADRYGELDDLFIQHCNSVDYYNCPVLSTACSDFTNSYCLDKLLSLTQLDVNAHVEYNPLDVQVKDTHTIKRLINIGASVSGVAGRKTPLMCAIQEHTMAGCCIQFETVSLLLEAGADLEVADQNGETALNYVCRVENLKDVRRTISALILANVDYYRVIGEDGKLPLMSVEPFRCFYDRNECKMRSS